MDNFPNILQDKLLERETENSLRTPGSLGNMIDFSSNDYLGFAGSEELFSATNTYITENNIKANGATGSRLISGNYGLYDVTEAYIAQLFNEESALIFNSGYDANLGFFSSVPQKGDVVLFDEYIHASIRDGLKLGPATSYKFPHNDVEALYSLVERHRFKAGEMYIVTESVFSMDGDTPNLHDIADIARRYKCRLVVDEAHAVGVLGPGALGLVPTISNHENVFARIVTFSKAFGVHGAAVLGPAQLKNYLLNFARSFIYTTALPPHTLAAIFTSCKMMQAMPQKQEDLHAIIMHFKEETEKLNLDFILSFSAIHCIIVPGNERVKRIAKKLQDQGFGIKAILSPTVPQGQERLRFCLHTYNTKTQVSKALSILIQELRFL
ncbi:aminotransferase class I/II-fold pyridoxal phosphate-dependent enzyme [Flavobacterium rhizosphaerae]|uniref:8-amino-7-oxononanoate synthase n=1 Tax=Flavobacterium rhizosphaerae TaxID=3163298 RepID=A0ABW8YSH7_9FLAO